MKKSTKVIVKGRKASAGVSHTKSGKTAMDVAAGLSNKKGVFSGSERYKAVSRQQRNEANLAKRKYNKIGGWIESGGKAIAEAASPFMANRTAKTITEQVTANSMNRAQLAVDQAKVKAWEALMDGNPEVNTGSDGSNQRASSTTNTSAGPYSNRGVVD